MRTKIKKHRDSNRKVIGDGTIGFLAAALFAGGIATIVLNSMSYAL